MKTHLINWSLTDPLYFLQAGNDFGEEFDELQYVKPQVMIIKLEVEEPRIIFYPLFKDLQDILLRCFSEIIASGDGLTRVSWTQGFSFCIWIICNASVIVSTLSFSLMHLILCFNNMHSQ